MDPLSNLKEFSDLLIALGFCIFVVVFVIPEVSKIYKLIKKGVIK